MYNSEKSLPNLLDALSRVNDAELILINDGSTDKSLDILKKFQQDIGLSKPIRIIDQLNQGPAAARNQGIRAAKGSHIAFIDSDDTIDFKLLNDAYSAIDSANDITVFNEYNEETVSLSLGDELRGKIENSILTFNKIEILGRQVVYFPAPWGKIYRTDIIKQNDVFFPLDVYVGEDMLFNLRLIQVANTIGFNRKVFYSYEINPYSLTNSFTINIADNLYAFVSNLKDLIADSLLKKMLPSFIITDILRCIRSKKNKEELDKIADLIKMEHLEFKGLNLKQKVLFFLINNRMWGAISLLVTIQDRL